MSTEYRIAKTPSNSIFRERMFQRLLFFIRILLMLFLNFLLLLVFSQVLDIFSLSSQNYIIAFWIGYAITTTLAVNVGFFFGKWIAPDTLHSSLVAIWNPLKVNRRNWVAQLKYMVMLLFLIYIPLDFLGYCVPGMLEYSAQSLLNSSTGDYLGWDLQYMLPVAMIVHFCVAFREEFYMRNFFLTTAEKTLERSTSLIYASIYFGLAHFNYIFAGPGNWITAIYPSMWGIFAAFIGLVAAFFFLEKRMLWPLIIAHWVNNVISAMALQQYLAGIPFIRIASWLYLPLLLISLIIFIVKYQSISRTILNCWDVIKTYREINKVKEPILSSNISSGSTISVKPAQSEKLSIPLRHDSLIAYILVDVLFLFLLWFSSLFLF